MNGISDYDTYVFNASDTSADLALFETVSDTEGMNKILLYGMDIAGMSLLPTDSAVYLLQTAADSIFIRGLKTGAIRIVQVDGTKDSANTFLGKAYVCAEGADI